MCDWISVSVYLGVHAALTHTHAVCVRVCVHLWHALRRPSADSGLWHTTKLALLSTAVKTSIREQRHSWLVSESLSFALCSQAKWLERFNQQRHWKDSYLPAFHLVHSSSLTAALAFPSSTTYLRDRHFPSKDKYGKRHKETEKERRTMVWTASFNRENHCPGRQESNPQVWFHCSTVGHTVCVSVYVLVHICPLIYVCE